jgi:phenylacetate-CoA ligase
MRARRMRTALGCIYPFSVKRELRMLGRAEYLAKEDLLSLQEDRLKRLLQHAYTNVPYYRRAMDETGLLKNNSDDLLDENNFSKFPFLTKEILRIHQSDLISKDIRKRKFYYNTSGGSTGEPVRFIQDLEYKHWVRGASLLYDRWTGYNPGMPKIILWGSERDFLEGRERPLARLKSSLKNEVLLNTFTMSETHMHQYVEAINHLKPVQILAYVESIYELARFIEKKSLMVYSPKVIMTSAGTLYPNMRQIIERVFRAPVFNRYGSREVGAIACECGVHQGLHVSPLNNYIEIIREDGSLAAPGEVGEIVVTCLANYAMPLIRYRIGDLGVWAEEECSCGRKWPLLKEVSGRINSIIKTKNGVYDSTALTTSFYFKDEKKTQTFMSFSRYQLVQKALDRFVLRVVVQDSKLWKKERESLKMNLIKILGEDIDIHLEEVDEIAPSPSGKHLYILSELT